MTEEDTEVSSEGDLPIEPTPEEFVANILARITLLEELIEELPKTLDIVEALAKRIGDAETAILEQAARVTATASGKSTIEELGGGEKVLSLIKDIFTTPAPPPPQVAPTSDDDKILARMARRWFENQLEETLGVNKPSTDSPSEVPSLVEQENIEDDPQPSS